MTHIGHSEKVFVMKRLLLILILTLSFQSWTKADDIRDFQIEGMSIGDSLLDYFSANEIKNNKKDYYTNDKFTAVDFRDKSLFKNYDGAQIHYKTKGNKYIIYALDFVLEFENQNTTFFKNICNSCTFAFKINWESIMFRTELKKRLFLNDPAPSEFDTFEIV